jgi:DNA modification methylase
MAPEMRRLADLKPAPRNARTHSEAQIQLIANSITEFGFVTPILIDEANTIIAGHGRALGAKVLGWEEGPVIVARGWSEAQKRAYLIADNRIAEKAGWNAELLSIEFGELEALAFDLDVLGFSELERRVITARGTVGLTDPDEVPPAPKKAIAKPGDTWILGDHRLHCGDSTSESDVAACLAGARPHLMVTDPPYGVLYDASWRNHVHDPVTGKSKKARAIGKVLNDDRADWTDAWKLFPGTVCYIWHGALHAGTAQQSLEAAGFKIRAQIVWTKSRLVLGRGDYHWQHEPAWYAVKDGMPSQYDGGRKQSTTWMIEHRRSETGHSTQKPIEAMRRPIMNNSKPGDFVYDPFLGSGTTLIACEMEARKCLGLELEPKYVDVIVQRWEAFTGRKAERVAPEVGA